MVRNLHKARRTALGLAACMLVVGLAGCTSDKAQTTEAPATEAAPQAGSDAPLDSTGGDAAPQPLGGDRISGKKVVYLINGALGDKGFYDSGQAGIKSLEQTYGVTTRTLEANFDPSKYQSLVDAAFEEGDVVFAIAYGFEDALKKAAADHPDVPVVNLDFDIADAGGHITSVDFIEEESAYLAGMAAALVTTDPSIPGINADKKLGVVQGDSDPVTSSFGFAFTNGAKAVDPGITVEITSLGGAWDDQAKAKQATGQLYDSGVDVVFQVAAAAGLGVLQAAKDRGLYAIGVDANQNDLQPGHVIASDIKNLGGSIVKIAATLADGSYKAGQVLSYGIAQGGVDLDTTATKSVLPDATIGILSGARNQIIDGSLKVERYVAK
jgi:basic membrane protein A and related proteins